MDKTKIKNIFKRAGAAVLCGGILVGGALAFCYGNGYFHNDSSAGGNLSETGIAIICNSKSNGIALTGTSMKAEGEAYESYYEVIATVDNAGAEDTSVTWSLAWVSDTEDIITDYLTISSETTESGEAVTVYCYGAFSTQAILTAKANGGDDVTAEATVDYVARANGYLYINDVSYSDENAVDFISYNYYRYSLIHTLDTEMYFSPYVHDDTTENETGYLKVVLGTGTMEETYSGCTFTFSLTEAALEVLGFNTSNVWSVSVNVSDSESATLTEILYSLIFEQSLSDSKDLLSVLDDEDVDYLYSEIYNFYSLCENYIEMLDIEFSCTGDITGETFTFNTEVLVDVSGYNTETEGTETVSLNDTTLLF